jgi:hypothetical protein
VTSVQNTTHRGKRKSYQAEHPSTPPYFLSAVQKVR